MLKNLDEDLLLALDVFRLLLLDDVTFVANFDRELALARNLLGQEHVTEAALADQAAEFEVERRLSALLHRR